jgi:hypothetical protein
MSINPKLLEDAKLVNQGLYQTNGGKKFAEKKGIGNERAEVSKRTLQIVKMWNDGLRANEIHERIGGNLKAIKDALMRYRGDLTDRSGNYYDIKDLSGEDYDRIMRSLEACKRNVSRGEAKKIDFLQAFLRKFPRELRYMR